jgi:hypothetical protein
LVIVFYDPFAKISLYLSLLTRPVWDCVTIPRL